MSRYNFDDANFYALFAGVGDWYFMTQEERQNLHDEKQSLPSFAQEAKEAKERLKIRIKDRKQSCLYKTLR